MTVNRTQAIVLGFSLLAWLSLVAILVAAPEILDGPLRLPPGDRPVELAFLVALSALLALLAVGVIRRWRWTFWLVLVAFFAGILRVPASVLELRGILPSAGPTWYTRLQAAIGLVQFAIGLAMLTGFRKAGAWGAFLLLGAHRSSIGRREPVRSQSWSGVCRCGWFPGARGLAARRRRPDQRGRSPASGARDATNPRRPVRSAAANRQRSCHPRPIRTGASRDRPGADRPSRRRDPRPRGATQYRWRPDPVRLAAGLAVRRRLSTGVAVAAAEPARGCGPGHPRCGPHHTGRSRARPLGARLGDTFRRPAGCHRGSYRPGLGDCNHSQARHA